MKLSTFIDEKMESDVIDIIYQDQNGKEIELDPFKVEISDVLEMNYQKIFVIKVKSRS